MKQQTIIRAGDMEIGVTKEGDGSLYIEIRDRFDYGRGFAAIALSVQNKKTLLDFLNKPEPREWMLEVEKGTTNILGPYTNFINKEYIKVREVMDNEIH